MKVHTSEFKDQIKEFGKEIDSKITFSVGGVEIELGKEHLNSVTPHYEGDILKSVMKQLDIDSNILIPAGTEINYQFGLKVNGEYEYIDYGNYIVKDIEKQEDTRSWRLVCYDKMLYSMKEYQQPVSKNLFDKTSEITDRKTYTSTGGTTGLGNCFVQESYIPVESSTAYTLSTTNDYSNETDYRLVICEYQEDKTFIQRNIGTKGGGITTKYTITTTANTKYVRLCATTVTMDELQFEKGSEATNYVPYFNGYPITIKNYLTILADNIGLPLKDISFVNQDKIIENELYLAQEEDEEGNITYSSLDYTYRDVLDEIAGATASTICISKDDELEVRYVENVGTYQTAEGTSISIPNADDSSDLNLILKGNTSQTGTPTPSSPVAVNTVTGRQEVKVMGKNLSEITNYQQPTKYSYQKFEYNDIEVTKTATGGVFFASYNVYINQPGTYKITGNVAFTTSTRQAFYVYSDRLWGTNLGQFSITEQGNFTQSFNFANAGTYVIGLYGDSAVDSTFKVKDFMVSSAGGEYENKNKNYEINLGKNLLKLKDGEYTYQTSHTWNISDGTIKMSVNNVSIQGGSINVITGQIGTWAGTYAPDNHITPNGGTYLLSCIRTGEVTKGTNGFIGLYYFIYNEDGTKQQINVNVSVDEITTKEIVLQDNQHIGTITLYSQYVQCENVELKIQIEKGSSRTEFVPYKEPIELCKIGDYQDRIYKSGRKWYLEKKVGKVILNGTETWVYDSQYNYFRCPTYNFGNGIPLEMTSANKSSYNQYCSHFTINKNWSGAGSFRDSTTTQGIFYPLQNTGYKVLFRNTDYTTASSFQNWLSQHPTSVYYVLATPETTEITDQELIDQLENIKLLEGKNNIAITSTNLSSPTSITYLSERDYIDEHYLKDINVNFGEKYGKINSVVFSRSAESDNIYRNDESSIEENGLHEIKIIDNQILNSNDRDQFIDEIFKQLNGFEYYVNDFCSTGIGYYDLCDRYNIKIEDNTYNCVMLNNEFLVTQGLQENIHTDQPENSETDYTKADKTDRRINQAYIIVDKQNGIIQSEVSELNDKLYGENGDIQRLGSSITQTKEEIELKVSKEIDEKISAGATSVKTTSVTIDNDGLNVSTDTSKIATVMTNDAFKIIPKGSEEPLAYFGYDEQGKTSIAQMDNLTITNYLTMGNHRVEKFERDGEERTGFFYVGGS